MVKRRASVAVVGAGDYMGAAIARRFAREGYHVFAGRRNGDKVARLVAEIAAAGGACTGVSLDARQEDAVTGFLGQADDAAPLEAVVFNVGANVNFPLLETSERVFRKVWELACYAGFLTGREAARRLLAHGRGSIFFTGATASVRGGSGYTAFAGAKFGLRAVAQSMAQGGSLEDRILMNPASIADTYWQLHQQPRDAWTHELDLRPYQEPW